MDDTIKKFVEEQIEKLAHMVAKGFEQTATKDETASKEDIARLEEKMDAGFAKLQQEQDGLRDHTRVLETRVDHLEVSR